jgi:transcriptional regulator with XRE-family HTH domain
MQKSLRDVVAANIAKIMDNPTAPLTQEAVGKRSGLPQRTVGRLKNGSTAASLTTLGAISKGLGVEPWHLLVPDLDPTNLPVLRVATPEEQRLYQKFEQLLEETRKIGQ